MGEVDDISAVGESRDDAIDNVVAFVNIATIRIVATKVDALSTVWGKV